MNGELQPQPDSKDNGFGQAAELASMAAEAPAAHGTEHNVTSMAEFLGRRLEVSEERLNAYNEQHPEAAKGKHNYGDVTRNLLAGAKGSLRAVGEELHPDDIEEGYNPEQHCNDCVASLEHYVWALQFDDVREAEMKDEEGYAPDIRQEERQKRVENPKYEEIKGYVARLVERVRAEQRDTGEARVA
jgi:hypothetical protein